MKRLIYLLMLWPVARALAADPNPPLQASALGRSLVRQTTAANMRTVIGAMDSAAGITSATATNISAYQANIATNGLTSTDLVTAIVQSNLVSALDDRLFPAVQDQNLYFPNVAARMTSGLPIRMVLFGDDAINPMSQMWSVLSQWRTRDGTSAGAGGFIYSIASSGVTTYPFSAFVYSAPSYHTNSPLVTYGIPNNGGITNSARTVANRLTLNYFVGPSFGTLSVQTNNGWGGAFSVVCAINAYAATFAPAQSNISIAPSTVTAAVSGTTTNLVTFCGQANTTNGATYLLDSWEGGNMNLEFTMTNAAMSNATMMALGGGNYDLCIISDKNNSNSIYAGATLFYNAVSNRIPTLDVMFLSQPPTVLSDPATTWDERQAMARAGRDCGLSVLDIGGLFIPTNALTLSNYFQADGVHLTTFGKRLAGNRIASSILNPLASGWQNVTPPNLISTLRTNSWKFSKAVTNDTDAATYGSTYLMGRLIQIGTNNTSNGGSTPTLVFGEYQSFAAKPNIVWTSGSYWCGGGQATIGANNDWRFGCTSAQGAAWPTLGTVGPFQLITDGSIYTQTWMSQPTNYVVANFSPVAGQIKIVISNRVIYGVSDKKTNVLLSLE